MVRIRLPSRISMTGYRELQKLWSGKPMLLLARSSGGRGLATVLEAAKATFPRMGADLRFSFILPSFYARGL